MKKSDCFIVLGMHRSGTSMIAKFLHTLGINMGNTFRAPDQHNIFGYYEDQEWRNLNVAILKEAGGTWYEPPIIANVDTFKVELIQLIRRKMGNGPWGFKDPRTILTIPHLHPYLPHPMYIYVRREKEAVLASLKKRAQVAGYERSDESWLALIDRYEERATDFLLDGNIAAELTIVTYEQFIEDPTNQGQGLAYTVGIKDKGAICKAIETIVRT